MCLNKLYSKEATKNFLSKIPKNGIKLYKAIVKHTAVDGTVTYHSPFRKGFRYTPGMNISNDGKLYTE